MCTYLRDTTLGHSPLRRGQRGAHGRHLGAVVGIEGGPVQREGLLKHGNHLAVIYSEGSDSSHCDVHVAKT